MLTIGVDVGTSTLTALAWDPQEGRVLESRTRRSPSGPEQVAEAAGRVVRELSGALGRRAAEAAGIGITGQQHGVLLVDAAIRPLTPFYSWQDPGANETVPGRTHSYLEEARALLGPDAAVRSGCRLATGYMGVTLFRLKQRGGLPEAATACFLPDFLGSRLTGRPPCSDPTLAASSGIFDVSRRCWDDASIAALGLPRSLFPEIREATRPLGPLVTGLGLPPGIPVFTPLGDSQAAFLGGTRGGDGELFVNIGTGSQVAVRSDRDPGVPGLELRPLPESGFLLYSAQPGGGASYAALERFFHAVLGDFDADAESDLYDRMNALAAQAPPGAGGLRCDPLFWGTRTDPGARGRVEGLSAGNFSPASLCRALLEGLARVLAEDVDRIARASGRRPTTAVGCGNALRKNPLLARLVSEALGLPLELSRHSEEAAVGAARIAVRGLSLNPLCS
jgi:sugar (pentulose or hexulose) kinase